MHVLDPSLSDPSAFRDRQVLKPEVFRWGSAATQLPRGGETMLLSWEARKVRGAMVGEGAPIWWKRGRGPVGFPVNFGPADR